MLKKSHKTSKLHIKKGDVVKVLSGNYRNKRARVLKVLPKIYRAIVEGVHMVYRHKKPSAQNTQGGIEKKEAPIHISNLMLIDLATGEPTRMGRKRDENGKLQRYAKKTGELIKND
ncbi:MAG: 50S ribosomal protein L24 [Bacteroidota bacterium]